jgi:hypothetical protein
MHTAARQYVSSIISAGRYGTVIEVGGRDVNGGVRGLIRYRSYTCVDLYPGEGVDVVADCRDWSPPVKADLVLALEVLEHAEDPAGVVKACISYLADGGRMVLTCAGPGREPHSGIDGEAVRPGEHYQNIDPDDLRGWLAELDDLDVTQRGPDLYATGVRR